MKKILALVLALAMIATLGLAFADPTTITAGSITVKNAAMGETYYAIKALDAVVSTDGITYSTEIPDDLKTVIEVATKTVDVKDSNGTVVGQRTYQVVQKKDGVTDAQIQAAMRAFANTKKSSWGTGTVCTGNSVKFDNLEPGYYVIVSTLKTKDQTIETNKVSAGSTWNGDEADHPHTADGVVYEKNDTDVTLTKDADDESYSIGDTITYTVNFKTKNYMVDTDGKLKIITKFQVKDTLPPFLKDATVTKVQVGTVNITSTIDFTNFKRDGEGFDIPWADGDHDSGFTSKYANGTEIIITYTAVLTEVVNVNADNTNRISIIPWVDENDGPGPWDEPWEATDEITTYAAAVKKVDENGKALTGAQFKFEGIEAELTAEGVYTVTKTNAADADETVMTVDSNGMLYIIGLKEGKELVGTETKAPDGYNLLTSTFTVTPQVLTKEVFKESGHRYYDADDNLVAETYSGVKSNKEVEKNLDELNAAAVQVVNNKGTELPSTGGIGTTIFYVLGGLLVVGAAIILVARRKAEEK